MPRLSAPASRTAGRGAGRQARLSARVPDRTSGGCGRSATCCCRPLTLGRQRCGCARPHWPGSTLRGAPVREADLGPGDHSPAPVAEPGARPAADAGRSGRHRGCGRKAVVAAATGAGGDPLGRREELRGWRRAAAAPRSYWRILRQRRPRALPRRFMALKAFRRAANMLRSEICRRCARCADDDELVERSPSPWIDGWLICRRS